MHETSANHARQHKLSEAAIFRASLLAGITLAVLVDFIGPLRRQGVDKFIVILIPLITVSIGRLRAYRCEINRSIGGSGGVGPGATRYKLKAFRWLVILLTLLAAFAIAWIGFRTYVVIVDDPGDQAYYPPTHTLMR